MNRRRLKSFSDAMARQHHKAIAEFLANTQVTETATGGH